LAGTEAQPVTAERTGSGTDWRVGFGRRERADQSRISVLKELRFHDLAAPALTCRGAGAQAQATGPTRQTRASALGSCDPERGPPQGGMPQGSSRHDADGCESGCRRCCFSPMRLRHAAPNFVMTPSACGKLEKPGRAGISIAYVIHRYLSDEVEPDLTGRSGCSVQWEVIDVYRRRSDSTHRHHSAADLDLLEMRILAPFHLSGGILG
jgi:hypothetical protein